MTLTHELDEIMDHNHPKKIRRRDDQILMKTAEILEGLEKLSRGELVDLTETYTELAEMKNGIGRRQEDRRLVSLLCRTIKSLASNLNNLLKRDKILRQVKTTKAPGKSTSQLHI